mmetsp:Transcript_64065/g.119068  ORF Transcript_64065/g.119068 Transcript_64065/m.119068 type:complete len:211 (-) Transcript_64065:57-689(-)
MGHALDKCSYGECKRQGQSCHKDMPQPCQQAAYVCNPPNDIKRAKWRNQQLIAAARDGNIASLDEALKEGADVETRNPMKMVSLSAEKTRKKAGGSKARKDKNEGLSPLMHAATGGHLTCVMRLLEAQASLEAIEEEGLTPLHFAAMSGNLDVFKALVYAGADVDQVDDNEKAAMAYIPDDILSSRALVAKWEAVAQRAPPEGICSPDAL